MRSGTTGQVLDIAPAWAAGHLDDGDAVLIVDETADEKSSADAAGAARQPAVDERRQYLPYKIKSVTDTPAERVAHSLKSIPARQSPTPLGPGRNDLFHARVPLDFVRQVFAVIGGNPQHIYQALTKRSPRLRKVASRLDWPSNLWMGVSVEKSDALYWVDDLRRSAISSSGPSGWSKNSIRNPICTVIVYPFPVAACMALS